MMTSKIWYCLLVRPTVWKMPWSLLLRQSPAEPVCCPSSRVTALKALFDRTTVDARVSTDIRRDLWHKLVHLHTVASMTSLMRANVGEIVRTPEGTQLMQRVLDTNINIARLESYEPDDT